jgi:hypothetical protein
VINDRLQEPKSRWVPTTVLEFHAGRGRVSRQKLPFRCYTRRRVGYRLLLVQVFCPMPAYLEARLGNLTKRSSKFDHVAAVGLTNSSAHYALSQVYRKLGRSEDAEREVTLFHTLRSSPRQLGDVFGRLRAGDVSGDPESADPESADPKTK